MTDTTNDIDALLRVLDPQRFAGTTNLADLTRHYVALTALVAERDALLKRVEVGERQLRLANIDQFNTEAEANDRDRELRERDDALTKWMDQVTAMLCHSITHSHDAKQELVTRCDAAIAAMRKEETDGK